MGFGQEKVHNGKIADGSCVAVLENHVSVVRGLDFSADGATLVSGSRDQVVNFWDMKSFKLKITLPVYEVSCFCRIDCSLLNQWDTFLILTAPMVNTYIPEGVEGS